MSTKSRTGTCVPAASPDWCRRFDRLSANGNRVSANEGSHDANRRREAALIGHPPCYALRNSPWERPGGSLGILRATHSGIRLGSGPAAHAGLLTAPAAITPPVCGAPDVVSTGFSAMYFTTPT